MWRASSLKINWNYYHYVSQLRLLNQLCKRILWAPVFPLLLAIWVLFNSLWLSLLTKPLQITLFQSAFVFFSLTFSPLSCLHRVCQMHPDLAWVHMSKATLSSPPSDLTPLYKFRSFWFLILEISHWENLYLLTWEVWNMFLNIRQSSFQRKLFH